MLSLLYPAVLGSIFYSLLGFIFTPTLYIGRLDSILQVALSLAVVCHFCVDFLYVCLLRDYNFRQFAIDLTVVCLLYNAFLSIDPSGTSQNVRLFFLTFSAIYITFFPQELMIWRGYLKEMRHGYIRLHGRMLVHTVVCITLYLLTYAYYSILPHALPVALVFLSTVHYAYTLKLRFNLEEDDKPSEK